MTESTGGVERPATLLGCLLDNARHRPRLTAWRIKRRGAWRQTNWADAARDVCRVANALVRLGVEKGAPVAVVGDWEPELLVLDLATQALGSKPVALSAALGPEHLRETIVATEARVVICTDASALQRLAVSQDGLPGVEALVAVRGAFRTPAPGLAATLSLEELLGADAAASAGTPRDLEQITSRRSPADVAFAGFSPGTTGPPRRFEFVEASVVGAAAGMAGAEAMGPRDRALCYFPLSHPLGRILGAYAPLVCGASLNFLESSQTAVDDMAELAPTLLLAPPRLPELLHAVHERRLRSSTGLRRSLVASSLHKRRLLTGRLIRTRLGLREVRWFGCLGRVSGRMRAFYQSLGVPLLETYALTEAGGLVCQERAPGSGLAALESVELRVNDDGCLAVKTPWRPPALAPASAKTSGEPPWVQTDDVAEVGDGGAVRIVGRVVEQAGRCASLSEVERAIADTRYIRTAVAVPVGGALKIMIEPDFETVRAWAEGRQQVAVAGDAQLSRHPDVVTLIDDDARRAIETFDGRVTLDEVRLIPRELTVERGERTVTGGVRREVVIGAFATKAC